MRSSILKGSIKKEELTTPVAKTSPLNPATTLVQETLLDSLIQRELIIARVSFVRLIECPTESESESLKKLPKISEGVFAIKSEVYGNVAELELHVDVTKAPSDLIQFNRAFRDYLMRGTHE